MTKQKMKYFCLSTRCILINEDGNRTNPLRITDGWMTCDFYAPNFEEVEEAYWFRPVRLSVRTLRLLLVVKLENRLS